VGLTLDVFTRRCSSLELSALESLKITENDFWAFPIIPFRYFWFTNYADVLRGLPLLTELSLRDLSDGQVSLCLRKGKGDDDDGYANRQCIMRGIGHQDGREGSSNFSTAPEILPRLRSLSLPTDAGWLLLQAIINDRDSKGIPFDRIRFFDCLRGRIKDQNSKRLWLTERNIDYEFCTQISKKTVEEEDREWISGELQNRESYEWPKGVLE